MTTQENQVEPELPEEFSGESLSPVPEKPADQESTELEQLKQDAAKFRDQWMRAVAESDNIRKRAERDQQETSRYAITAFAREMVSVLENLTRAAESIEAITDAAIKPLKEGVELTLHEMLGIFQKHHIRRVDPMGQKFDHNLHQAVAQIESQDEPGTVIQVVQAGYLLHDRLLRPAMVVVAKQASTPLKPVDTVA